MIEESRESLNLIDLDYATRELQRPIGIANKSKEFYINLINVYQNYEDYFCNILLHVFGFLASNIRI